MPESAPTGRVRAQVLVVGATGATGSRVVGQLQQRGLSIRAGTRDVAKAEKAGVRGAVKADVLDPRQTAHVHSRADAVREGYMATPD